ncbi:hypothetical protein, partial [Stutzerimonas stutzeri]|uniref:hypothetical protein n=1 Tax=Stutzerimonas stutzeri TaxID=316 RepID=UPI001C614879
EGVGATAAALVDLSTVAGNKISNPPWVKFQSAGWVNFPSAPTESIINASGFRNIHGSRANTAALSASLPDWFLIYVTSATRSKSDKLPPAVLRSGTPNYFIGK